MSLTRQFAIHNALLYSGFVLPNVQIFFVQKTSFATFGVSIDDFFTRYAGLGYSLMTVSKVIDCCCFFSLSFMPIYADSFEDSIPVSLLAIVYAI